MKLSLVMILLASTSITACALDGTAPTPVGSDNSELDDPACESLHQAYEACDAREARYDAQGKRIEQYVCVEESNAWADCKNPRHAAVEMPAPRAEAIAVDPIDASSPDEVYRHAERVDSGAPPFITVPR